MSAPEGDIKKKREIRRIPRFFCVPGTRNNLAVKVRYRHGSRNC